MLDARLAGKSLRGIEPIPHEGTCPDLRAVTLDHGLQSPARLARNALIPRVSVLGVVLATRFSSSLEQVVPETVRAALAVGQFEELQNDPRALVDAATADRLRSDLGTSAIACGFAYWRTPTNVSSLAGGLFARLEVRNGQEFSSRCLLGEFFP